MQENSGLYLIDQAWLNRVKAMMDLNLDLSDIKAEVARQRKGVAPRVSGDVAVIPVVGPLSFMGSWLSALFGGSSTKSIHHEVQAALLDSTVKAIVMPIHSPGGSVSGLEELSNLIYHGRRRKPIIAIADAFAASAAFYIASAATEFVASPSAEIGSVGAVLVHEDLSELAKKAGVKPTLIHSGRHKVTGNPFSPLSDEDRDILQEQVDHFANQFRRDLARNRGVSVSHVRSRFGEGLMFPSTQAVERGMADRVETLDAVLSRAIRLSSARERGMRALAQADRLTAGEVRARSRAALAIADSIVRERR